MRDFIPEHSFQLEQKSACVTATSRISKCIDPLKMITHGKAEYI